MPNRQRKPRKRGGREVLIRVYWRTGIRCRGILEVELPRICEDPASAAEIVAFRYLLGERAVLGENRNGSGLRLTCSRGAVKKAARQDSSKVGLKAYSHPLVTRYAGADYTVSKDRDWLPAEGKAMPLERIDANATGRGIEVHVSRVLGRVAVTQHALERYVALVGLPVSSPWRSLTRLLDQEPLQRVELPPNVHRHKLKKYGESGQPEIWKHPDNPLHFVFVPGNEVRILVTVFELNR